MMSDVLDDDHPLWLVNEQIKGLLEGCGAGEDHEDVLSFLRGTGLPEGTVARMHRVLVCAELRLARLERLKEVEASAVNLVKVRGRHHSEIAYQRLVAVLGGQR